MITQELNPASSNMRVAHNWAAAIAARCDHLTILASHVALPELPSNVTVIPIRNSEREPRYLVFGRLCWYFLRLIVTRQVDVVFAHMVPIFAILAWPFCRLARRPLTLWYTSHGLTLPLRLANRLIDIPFTASADSYPIADSFPVVLGHGIDTAYMQRPTRSLIQPPLISLAARVTPLKQIELVIRALAEPVLFNHPSQPVVEIAGSPFYPDDYDYLDRLKKEVHHLGLEARITFLGGVSGAEMPKLYSRSVLTVSCRALPALDKSGLESIAAGVPVVTNNSSFSSIFGQYKTKLLFSGTDSSILAARLAGLLDDESSRERIAVDLQKKVEHMHGLDGFADRLTSVLRALVRSYGGEVKRPSKESKM